MNRWVLVCHGDALGGHPELVGKFLVHSDPDAFDGRGWADWTDDLARARHFDSFAEAVECWQRQSTVVPVRPDGRPNRPLTAFNIEPRSVA